MHATHADESSNYDSSDDDGYDPEGDVFHPGRGSRRQQPRSLDEQSYGYGSDGSAGY